MHRFAIIAGIKGEPVSSWVAAFPRLFFFFFFFFYLSDFPSLHYFLSPLKGSRSLYFQHLYPKPNPLRAFYSLSLILSCWLTPFLSISLALADHPDCHPCVLQLFPCCGSSLCYFVSAWLRLRRPPPRPIQPCFFLPCAVLPRVLLLSLLMPSKNRRGMAFVSSAGVPGGWKGARRLWLPTVQEGEVIQPGIPHLWQVLTHMSQPVTPGL